MSTEKKQISPATTVLLTLGAVTGIGLAYWSISNALPQPATAHAGNTPPANSPALPNPHSAASQPTTQPLREAELAPTADPFLTTASIQAQTAAATQTAPATPARPTPAPSLAANRGPQISLLPLNNAPGAPHSGLNGLSKEQPDPELAGTFMGDRTCAVFREGQELSVVPIGATYKDWKVVSVTHGGAVIQKGKRILNLEVGFGQSAAVRAPQSSPAAKSAQETETTAITDTPGTQEALASPPAAPPAEHNIGAEPATDPSPAPVTDPMPMPPVKDDSPAGMQDKK